ncbi:ATP-binding cassette, subfamily G (WHITE), eye pigment precursor transporter [Nematocida sp. AWRm80]|nr:ATP-binding cassette, subfamily G (WHITE), eye pigment precursor transporter [Nematocida sp. AWRm80]
MHATNTQQIENSASVDETAHGTVDFHTESLQSIGKKSSKKAGKFVFESIGYKTILKNVTDTLYGGKMTAILGPSGAGKTTLLKIISGRKQKTSGRFILNGKEQTAKKMRKATAYVHQENHLYSTLRVGEMLLYTIKLKAPKLKNPEKLADVLLEKLGLLHIKNSFIGDPIEGTAGISGGERKRLSVAQELISMPGILFLDEPTSGLDSYTSESLVLHLKNLTARGLMVAMTIHQPSSDVFNMFDNVIVLNKGAIVYSGTIPDCLTYVESLGYPCPQYTNPADHIFRVLDHLPPMQRVSTPLDNQIEREEIMTSKKTTAMGVLHETSILIKRNLLCGVRNKKYVFAKMAQALLIAIVTGILLYNIPAQNAEVQETNTLGCFWAISMAMFGSFSYGAISVLFSDRKIFIKEYGSSYYSFVSYFIAKVFVDFLITCVHPLISVPIIFICARIGSFYHILTCILLGAVGHSFGVLMSSSVDNSEVALAIFPGIVYPINMLTGTAVDPESIPAPLMFLQYLSPNRHA